MILSRGRTLGPKSALVRVQAISKTYSGCGPAPAGRNAKREILNTLLKKLSCWHSSCTRSQKTADHREAVQAFIDKRKAVFAGK